MGVVRELMRGATIRALNTTWGDLLKAFQEDGSDVPILVKFKRPIFEDDFVDAGMLGYFVGIEDYDEESVKLFFYFGDEEIEKYNNRLMRAVYCKPGETKEKTAVEAGWFVTRYSVYVMKTDRIQHHVKVQDYGAAIVDLTAV